MNIMDEQISFDQKFKYNYNSSIYVVKVSLFYYSFMLKHTKHTILTIIDNEKLWKIFLHNL